MLPMNVIDCIVKHTSRQDRINLALTDQCFKHAVYDSLYRKIVVIDNDVQLSVPPQGCTIVRAEDLYRFAASLTRASFQYIRQIVINTHRSGDASGLLALYDKLALLWNESTHRILFVSYDVVTLRAAGSLNNYLEHNSFSHMESEDEVLTRRSRKLVNLHDWLMADMAEFLRAPENGALRLLHFFVQNNFQQDRINNSEEPESAALTAPLQNLQTISALHLHTPLSFIKFVGMLQQILAPRLKLARLSLTSVHRLVNDARLDFGTVIRHFDLNQLEELELRISCARRHECQDTCMVQFFDEWKRFNAATDNETRLRKLAIVHHKSPAELQQFKPILENYVFSLLFANLEELYVNCSSSARVSSVFHLDLVKIMAKLHTVPRLRVLHVSSFFCEWVGGLRALIDPADLQWHSFHHTLCNMCACDECNSSRGLFTKLAEIDKSNNYSHKVKLAEVPQSPGAESLIDFSADANSKFYQYVALEFRKEEAVMEQNLPSTGTMLDMENMPLVKGSGVGVFKQMLVHSCLGEVFAMMAARLPQLQLVNFGGIQLEKGAI